MKIVSKTTVFFIFFFACRAYAQNASDNIIIDNKTETYFYKSLFDAQVILEKSSKTDYRCLKWPETILVAEFYDDNSEISSASVKADRKIIPNYQMCQQDGIFYSDTKACYFDLPFTKKEEAISVSFKKTYNDIRLFWQIQLAEPQYVKQKTVEIVIPSWMSVDIIGYNIGENIRKSEVADTKNGTVRHIYAIKGQEAGNWQKDAPGYYKTGPYLILVPRKASLKKAKITFFNDFSNVYKWCKEKIDMTANDDQAIADFTGQIVPDSLTEEDKIARIFSWVQNNIRYLAFTNGLAGFVPDNAQDVLRKKYGDCKGMSNLLKTMLRSAGFDARLVWVGTKDIYSDTSIPVPAFNHMICALYKDGAVIYLDPTVKYMEAGEYHETIQGRPTMIENGDSYALGHVPQMTIHRNMDSLYCQYKIDGNTLAGEASLALSGGNKHFLLSMVYAQESSRRKNTLRQFLEKGKPQNKVSGISMDSVASGKSTLYINYKEVRDGCVNKIGDEIYINMDTRQDFASAKIDTAKRKSDIEYAYREFIVREEYLQIPEGYELISLPANIDIENNNFWVSIRHGTVGRKIQYRKVIKIENTWLKRQDFERWNNDIDRLNKSYRDHIIIRKIQTEI